MPYFLGFDVAKAKLDWSLIDERGGEQDHGQIGNSQPAITALLNGLKEDYPAQEIVGVVEATGVYHYPVLDATWAAGWVCFVYNPLLTRQQIKATVRGKKTDRSDAFLVARVGWSGGGRPYTPELHPSTKHHARSCQKLSVFSTSFRVYRNHLTSLLEQDLSPEAQQALAAVQETIIAAKQQLTKDLVTSMTDGTSKLLQTIPGIGPYTSASIIGEIQDIGRFKTVKALTAFAGLDPKIKQSGHTLNSTGKLTKRGSSYLRRSLFIAANVARQHDPQFKALYDKKRAEGKAYTVAICVVSRKLLAVVRSVWLSGKAYGVPTPSMQIPE